ncbi:uncharacterized protein AMSG_04662 [Thecamonas trahens ATCC 50062]|uniref:Uncharacterized protein n=1 Tax=Thecamonas trahens ATCC 50062 TaxID=461836 RepID=A0A0L0D954_THETB|nr:hypothetical protein AMSG_04662 [Thecamonas trahens ATCC 50062]KNC48917.1 hypothetical protein AMSG_04662 [Thecamonas trahens ATCC 50062]|eukprot:XP_013758334.1 hypothetical protein AMSG_04662 [Thecamonas trahens ATCC 50062]
MGNCACCINKKAGPTPSAAQSLNIVAHTAVGAGRFNIKKRFFQSKELGTNGYLYLTSDYKVGLRMTATGCTPVTIPHFEVPAAYIDTVAVANAWRDGKTNDDMCLCCCCCKGMALVDVAGIYTAATPPHDSSWEGKKFHFAVVVYHAEWWVNEITRMRDEARRIHYTGAAAEPGAVAAPAPPPFHQSPGGVGGVAVAVDPNHRPKQASYPAPAAAVAYPAPAPPAVPYPADPIPPPAAHPSAFPAAHPSADPNGGEAPPPYSPPSAPPK